MENITITINALIARLMVYGLTELAEEVKNAASVSIGDVDNFRVLDEEGYGSAYYIEGDNETTVVYAKLVEPEGGTEWMFSETPVWKVPVPEGVSEEAVEVVTAILNTELYAGKDGTGVPANYFENTCRQRLSSGTGSIYKFISTVGLMRQYLICSPWEKAENPNVAPGCVAYKTTNITSGQYGMVPVADQPDNTVFVIEDQKGTGKVSLVMRGAGRIPAKETWLIVGSADNGEPVVFTFHPGEPVPRATTSTEELPVGTVLTKQEAIALGFNLAKVG